jgi:hypothetical protein
MKSLQYVRIEEYKDGIILSTVIGNVILGALIPGESFRNSMLYEIDEETQKEILMIENYYKNEKVCN